MGDLSPHFDTAEAFPPRVNRDKLSVPYPQALAAARYLAVAVLEPWRADLGTAIAILSWARDVDGNVRNAKDPASIARVKERPGPHTTGEASDNLLVNGDKLPSVAAPGLADAALYARGVRAVQVGPDAGPSTLVRTVAPPSDRDAYYLWAFHRLWYLSGQGVPVRRAILELTKPSDDAGGRGRPQHVAQIHVQATEGKASRVFVVRDWMRNEDGVWCEWYRPWSVDAPGWGAL